MLDVLIALLKFVLEHKSALPIYYFHVIDAWRWQPYQWAGVTIAGFTYPLFFRKKENGPWRADFNYLGCAAVADVIGESVLIDQREIQNIIGILRVAIVKQQSEEIRNRWAKGRYMIGDLADRRENVGTYPDGQLGSILTHILVDNIDSKAAHVYLAYTHLHGETIEREDPPHLRRLNRNELVDFVASWRPDCIDPYDL